MHLYINNIESSPEFVIDKLTQAVPTARSCPVQPTLIDSYNQWRRLFRMPYKRGANFRWPLA